MKTEKEISGFVCCACVFNVPVSARGDSLRVSFVILRDEDAQILVCCTEAQILECYTEGLFKQ